MDENTCDDQLHIPQVVERKPKIGMKFASDDEAYLFYNQYARESGFSARIGTSKKNKVTNEVVWKKFVCFKEGCRSEKRRNIDETSYQTKRRRARGEVRTGCMSKISILKEQTSDNWVVTTFQEGHNHPLLTPSKVHLLRSHRHVSKLKKVLTQQFSEANIPTCQQMRLLDIEYGGLEHVGCMERDIRNFEKSLRDEQKGIDAETLLEFCFSAKEKNSGFFFDYETDEENRFCKFFWADHVSRRAYSLFGDVVVFDTTYNTNKYGMIFAPFVGVNHHHQTVVFGCGFLSDEKSESFIRLLKKFLEAMSRGAPTVIITDQDPAMAKAIALVYPQTVHRYCLWHILNKFPEKLSPITFREHYQTIKNVITKSTSPSEFEESWEEAIKCTNLEENDWLVLMFELRHRWVPAYFNHIFCAGISSSQRSESSHAFFKRYVSHKNSLMDFITRFNRAVRRLRHNELIADHIDMNEQPKIKSKWPMEGQMVKVYTRKKWLEFQIEMSESDGYYIHQVCTEGNFVVYNVVNFQHCSTPKPKVLKHDLQMDYVSCSCMKFSFEGIPCRHMLAFFRVNQVYQLPDKYILKRWTRDAKIGALYDICDENAIDDLEKHLISRHSSLTHRASILVDDASLTEEATLFVKEQFDVIYGKIKEINNGMTCRNEGEKNKKLEGAHSIADPIGVRTKGCGKRLKSTKENARTKSRLCRGCGVRGVAHDKRNCPNLRDGSTTSIQQTNDDEMLEENFPSMDDNLNE